MEEPGINLAVVGSRSFRKYVLLKRELDKIRQTLKISAIISGGAYGADKLGERYAEENEIPIILLLPDWKKHGRGAGLKRNSDIVDQADYVIAFWDGHSKGTLDTINKTKKTSKKLKVIEFP